MTYRLPIGTIWACSSQFTSFSLIHKTDRHSVNRWMHYYNGSRLTGSPGRPVTPVSPRIPWGPCGPWSPGSPGSPWNYWNREIGNYKLMIVRIRIVREFTGRPSLPGAPASPWTPGSPYMGYNTRCLSAQNYVCLVSFIAQFVILITESERTILHDNNTIITAIYSNMYIEIMWHQSCHYYATYACCIGVFIQKAYSEWL